MLLSVTNKSDTLIESFTNNNLPLQIDFLSGDKLGIFNNMRPDLLKWITNNSNIIKHNNFSKIKNNLYFQLNLNTNIIF
jgi:hypothetical protein